MSTASKPFCLTRIAGSAIDTAHLIDVALALQLVEQPFGADLGVGNLIAGHDIRFRSADGLVRRNDDDPLVGCRLDDAVERFFVRRVYDDRVDAGRNQRAQVRDLLGRPRFAIGENDFRNQARSEGLGFDRADELFAPAISDMSVGDPDDELVCGAGVAVGRRCPHAASKASAAIPLRRFIIPPTFVVAAETLQSFCASPARLLAPRPADFRLMLPTGRPISSAAILVRNKDHCNRANYSARRALGPLPYSVVGLFLLATLASNLLRVTEFGAHF